MKKLLAGLLAVCLAMLQLGAVITPVSASEASVVTVKAVYYVDHANYPTAVAQTETATANGDRLGGKVRWDYGILTIEPESGYTLGAVYSTWSAEELQKFLDTDGNEGEVTELTVSTFGAVKENLVSNPDNLDTLLTGIEDGMQTIYLPRSLYQPIGGQLLFVMMKNAAGASTIAEFKLESDGIFVRTEDGIAIGQVCRFDAFEEIATFLSDNSMTMMDFDIDISAGMGYEIPHIEVSADQETYSCGVNGNIILTLTSKQDGRSFMVMDEVKKPSYASEVKIIWNEEELQLNGMPYYNLGIPMEEGAKNAELSFQVKLPEGVSVVWEETRINKGLGGWDGFFQENKDVNTSCKEGEAETNVTYTLGHKFDTTAGLHTFMVKKSAGFTEPIYLMLTDGVTKYQETLYITSVSEATMSFSSLGADRYYVAPNSVHSLFEFMQPNKAGLTKAQAQKQFLEYLDEGKLIMENFCGATLVQDGTGHYTGEIIINRSGFGFNVIDAQTKQSVGSADMMLVCNNRVAVLAGEKVSLEDFIGDQWGDVTVQVDGAGFAYDAEKKVVSTPTTVSGAYATAEVVVKADWGWDFIVGAMTINVINKDKFDDALADILENEVGDNEQLVIDSADSPNKDKDKGTLIAKKILNALKGKTDTHLKIETKDKNREIIWDFGSDTLEGADKDLMVDVSVSDVKVSGHDGVELKFKDNGILPGTAYVRISLTATEAKSLGITEPGQTIKLQYRDEKKGAYVTEQDALTVYADPMAAGMYYIEVPVTHNSTFILTTATKAELGAVPPADGGNGDAGDKGNDAGAGSDAGAGAGTGSGSNSDVQTGDHARAGLWISLMALMVLMGAGLSIHFMQMGRKRR